MQAAYRRTSATHRLLPLPSWHTDDSVIAAPDADHEGRPASARHYGADKATNWPMICVLVLVHAALFAALVKFDVIPMGKPAPKPIVVELIEMPEPAAPPPAAPTPPDPVTPPLVTPDPIVRTEIAPPPMVVAVQPPKIDVVVAAKAVAGPPAPMTPPDFGADYLNNPAPRYPVESRHLREQGTVTIKVLVSPEGVVQELKLAESSGHSRLDKAALSAVRNWRFAPAKQAGKPVAAWVIVPIPFVLKG